MRRISVRDSTVYVKNLRSNPVFIETRLLKTSFYYNSILSINELDEAKTLTLTSLCTQIPNLKPFNSIRGDSYPAYVRYPLFP